MQKCTFETLKTGRYWRPTGYIGFRSANTHHRIDIKPGTKPLTIFIAGPYGLRKGPRSEYGIDFKTKKGEENLKPKRRRQKTMHRLPMAKKNRRRGREVERLPQKLVMMMNH